MARRLGVAALVGTALTRIGTSQQTPPAKPARRAPADWANTQKYRATNLELQAHSQTSPLVMFFGDSLTEQWGIRNAAGVSETGNFLTEHGYLNRGISGQTTAQMLVRFRQDTLDLHPDVLVLLAGTNDIAGNTGPMTLEQTEENLQSMTELARVRGISVILCSLPPADKFSWAPQVNPRPSILKLNAWIKQYAAAQQLPFVDYFSALVSPEGGMRSNVADDGVHPNKAGYALMQPLVETAIEQVLAKPVAAAK